MRLRPGGTSKIRGSGRAASGMATIAAGQAGAGYTKLPDNSYVLQADIEALKQSWPEGYKILTEQGFTAYQDALTSTTKKRAGAVVDIKARYTSLTADQKRPQTLYTGEWAEYVKYPKAFEYVQRLSPKATEIPKTPGFYGYTDKSSKVNSKTKETTTKTTTYVYARLEDGSVIRVDKTTDKKVTPGMWVCYTPGLMVSKPSSQDKAAYAKWLASGSPGYTLVDREAGMKWVNRSVGGLTHEQKLGATKLSKEKGVPYEQALGLVSASGYYDPDAIVKLPGTTGYGIYDPKTGERLWGALTPEVASALKKLKPFEKADSTYDWTKIILSASTPVALAATKVLGVGMAGLKGRKDSIKAYPELGVALSRGGWRGYQAEADKIKREWEAKLKKDSPELYGIYKAEGSEGVEKRIQRWQNVDKVLTDAGYKEGEGYLVVQALVSDDPQVVVAIKQLFVDKPEVISDAEKFIQDNYMPQWKEGSIPLAISKKWRELTPWKEEKGETLATSLSGLVEKIPTQLFTITEPVGIKDLFPRKPFESGTAWDKRLRGISESEVASARAKWVAKYGDQSTQDVAVSETVKWLKESYLPAISEFREAIHAELSKEMKGTFLSVNVMFPKRVTESPSAYKKRLAGLSDAEIEAKRSEMTPKVELAGKPFLAVPEALADIIAIIPGTIAGVGGASLLQASKGETQEALLAPAVLLAGMGEWFMGRPIAFTKDPLYEIPYTVVLLGGEPFKTVFGLAKKAKVTLNPREINATALSLEVDIARTALPKNMDAFSARGLIEAVEMAWGGKGKVPVGVTKLKPWEQVILTAVAKNTDVAFKGKDGKIIGRVSPFQMTTGQSAFHATGDISSKALGGMLKDKGYFNVESEGTYSGFWASQQFSQAFIIRGPKGVKNPGGVMIRFTPKDLMELPASVLRLKDFESMKMALSDMAKAGKLRPGIYPVFKHYGKPPKFELELFISPGTKLKAVKPKWYAPEVEGTASIKTQSMISYKDPISGVMIKEGQGLPILVVATEAALKEGLGVPTLKSLYGAKLLSPYVALKKWAPWRIRLRERVTGDAEVPSVGSPLLSTFKGIKLEGKFSFKQWVKNIAGSEKGYVKPAKILEDIIKFAERDFKAKRAEEVKLRAAERAKKGEDYEVALLEEMMKDADVYFKDVFDPNTGKAKKWLDQREKYERLYEEYGQLPYKPTKRGIVLLYPEADLREGKLRRGTEYKPEGVLEYMLSYPRISSRYYPLEKEPALEPYPEMRGYTKPEPYPEVRITPYREPKPEPYPEPKPEYPPERPPKYPPEYPPDYPPKYPPVIPPPKIPPPGISASGAKGPIRVPSGSIAWRQGVVWKYLPPPWDQAKPITLSQAPIGAVKTGNKTPRDTIQLIGKSKIKVPESASVDLGVVDILVTKHGRAIEFKGGGEKTVVGQRIGGATTGMSIPASAPLKVKGIRGTSKEALKKLALGTTLSQLVEGNYNSKIPRSTVSRMLTGKLGGSSAKEIADVLRSIEVEPSTGEILAVTSNTEALATTGYTKDEVLKRLPDSKRREVERLLAETVSYAPTRGYPKFTVAKSKLSRKKKTAKSSSRQEVEPGAMVTR